MPAAVLFHVIGAYQGAVCERSGFAFAAQNTIIYARANQLLMIDRWHPYGQDLGYWMLNGKEHPRICLTSTAWHAASQQIFKRNPCMLPFAF